MSVSNVLKKVADARFAAEGFIRGKSETPGIWMYRRIHDGVTHSMYFQKSDYGPRMSLLFKNIELSQLVNVNELPPCLSKPYLKDLFQSVEYRNEDQLATIINAMVDAAIEKVIPFFDSLTRPSKHPPIEMSKELANDTKNLAERFANTYHLKCKAEISEIKELARFIDRLIAENQNSDLHELNELLLTSAAYLGELIAQTHKGIWEWHNNNYYVVIDRTVPLLFGADNEPIKWAPLFILHDYLRRPDFYTYTIYSSYKVLLEVLFIEDYYGLPERMAKRKEYIEKMRGEKPWFTNEWEVGIHMGLYEDKPNYNIAYPHDLLAPIVEVFWKIFFHDIRDPWQSFKLDEFSIDRDMPLTQENTAMILASAAQYCGMSIEGDLSLLQKFNDIQPEKQQHVCWAIRTDLMNGYTQSDAHITVHDAQVLSVRLYEILYNYYGEINHNPFKKKRSK